jgi:hypothetical protein
MQTLDRKDAKPDADSGRALRASILVAAHVKLPAVNPVRQIVDLKSNIQVSVVNVIRPYYCNIPRGTKKQVGGAALHFVINQWSVPHGVPRASCNRRAEIPGPESAGDAKPYDFGSRIVAMYWSVAVARIYT